MSPEKNSVFKKIISLVSTLGIGHLGDDKHTRSLDIDENEFVELIDKIFRQRGYQRCENNQYDGSLIDLVLEKEGNITLVVCCPDNREIVSESSINELYSVMSDNEVRQGIMITCGVFDTSATEYSLGKSILLINGADLAQMAQNLDISADESQIEKEDETPALSCPRCGAVMVKRFAKKGKNAGNQFWGCSEFPRCKSIITIK